MRVEVSRFCMAPSSLARPKRETPRWIFGISQETWPQVGGLEHGNNDGDLW